MHTVAPAQTHMGNKKKIFIIGDIKKRNKKHQKNPSQKTPPPAFQRQVLDHSCNA